MWNHGTVHVHLESVVIDIRRPGLHKNDRFINMPYYWQVLERHLRGMKPENIPALRRITLIFPSSSNLGSWAYITLLKSLVCGTCDDPKM